MKRHISILGFLIAAFVLGIAGASAQDGLRGALSRAGQTLPNATGFTGTLAAADFDSDSHPDGAVLSQAGWLNGQRLFRIDLYVTAGRDVTIRFRSADRDLDISAIDVNRDGAPDIVVEQAFTHQRVQVFLNNGNGVFEKADSESFSIPDDSTPGLRPRFNGQDFPDAYLPPTRGYELSGFRSEAFPSADDVGAPKFWPEIVVAQGGPHAPTASRAPPSFLSL